MERPERIPLSEPTIGELEATYLMQCVRDNWVGANGRFVAEFEALFASIHGKPDAASTSSGTAALHLALRALDVGRGDEVVVPALTFAASAFAVTYVGATPIFVDVTPDTYTIDLEAARAAITPRTRAIMAVHLYGHPADMDGVLSLAREFDLAVIEDATEALGSRYRGTLCGTLGDVGCFSFNGNKLVTSGGGGMVLTRRSDHLERVRHLSRQARVPGSREYAHDLVGFNYTLSNLHAAVGLAQIQRLQSLLAHRRRLAARYRNRLTVVGLRFSQDAEWAESNHWLMSVLVDEQQIHCTRDQIIDFLERRAITTRPFFAPLQSLPPFAHVQGAPCPVAYRIHRVGICLPSSSSLDDETQDRVIDALLDAARAS